MDDGLLADCRIGRGRALVLADADMTHDLLWRGPGANGAAGEARAADNVVFIADLLAALERRGPMSVPVAWIAMPSRAGIASLLALMVPLAVALGTGFRRRTTP